MKRRNLLKYSCLLIIGCSATTNSSTNSDSATRVNLPTKLRFAVTDANGLTELQQDYEPFRVALEKVLATSVEFFPVQDYFMAASALQSNQVDLVWAGPSEYVVIRARTNAVPVISLTRPGYHAVIVVRADSNIKSPPDLKGKKIDMWKLGSTAAHIAGSKLLIDAGLNPQTDLKIIMSGDDSLNMLKTKRVDAIVRPFHRYKIALANAGATEREYPIIAQGKQLPGDVFVLNSQLEPAVVAQIQSRILSGKEQLLQAIDSVKSLSVRFKNAKVVLGNDADFDVLREVYQAIGQDKFI
ncbi:phosphate/phosphite/phosphonate ABC transporter substrate-binding protein [Calothrix sp. PCC 7507]|uniref:phosphate/phosphite/phosphonate ABC transporter substrate-binding protein n=1 Tax=Calothrix sp. PCC 7507 TaxID=99598 RepID=UPI0005A7D086|nr:PhnD/SsuA/transferrin family substrate-binding protein [Calothrix sp. PCC 7507]